MFQGQILNSGSAVYSPWMERAGDYLRATVDLIDLGASGKLRVQVFSKNKSDTTNGTEVNAGTKIELTAASRATEEWGPSTGTGLKELVRYKLTNYETTNTDAWVLFRMLAPLWFNAVA